MARETLCTVLWYDKDGREIPVDEWERKLMTHDTADFMAQNWPLLRADVAKAIVIGTEYTADVVYVAYNGCDKPRVVRAVANTRELLQEWIARGSVKGSCSCRKCFEIVPWILSDTVTPSYEGYRITENPQHG